MVDLVDIGFSVDSSQIKTAKQELAELGNSFNSATKSASIFEQAFARAAAQSAKDAKFVRDTIRANQDLINANLGVSNSYKSAEQSASAFGVVLSNIDKASKAFAANFNGVVGITGGRATSNGAGFGAIEGEIERLSLKYNEIYASSKLYEKSLEELNRAHMLGVTSTKQHEAALESLNMEYQNFQNGVAQAGNRFAQYSAQSASGLGKFGVATQQLGYQVGDFLVQVQSGTNWMVAFGQQATQLVGVLPTLAGTLGMSVSSLIAISTGLGIAIPLVTAIGAYFMRTSESAKKSADSVDAYSEALKGLQNSIKDTQLSLDKLSFGTEDPVIAAAKKAQAEAEAQLALARANQRKIGNALAPTTEQSAALREAVINWTNISGVLRELEAKQAALAEAQRMLNGGLSVAGSLQQAAIRDKQEQLRLAREQAIAEQAAADKATFLKNVFHAMAGEAGAVSTSLKGWAGEILTAVDAMSVFGQYMFKVNNLSGMMGRGLPANGMPANFTQYSPTDYSGRAYGGAFAEDRLAGSSTPPTIKGTNATGTGVGGAVKKDPLAELQKQITLQEELNGKTEAEQKVRQALGDDYSKYSSVVIKGLEDQIQKQIELEDHLKEQQGLYDTIQSSMEDAFMSMVDGTKSAKDAFKSMAAAIIKELYNVLVVQQLVGSFDRATGAGSGIVGMIGSALIKPKANGGPISAGMPYLVGERGPEMIIPKSSGTVLTNGQTKAALGGASNDNYVVHNNITVTGSDSVMVRQEIAKMIPQISSATKAAMIDAKRRGGQMGNAFR